MRDYTLTAKWDAKAGVYFSETDIPGLNIEAATVEEFFEIAADLIRKLRET